MDLPVGSPAMRPSAPRPADTPVGGPAAGPVGGPVGGPPTPYERELALFLSLHLGRAPGVLWPEQDQPALARLGVLADRLARLTGLSAGGTAFGRPGSADWESAPWESADRPGEAGHLLVHQVEGASTWSLAGPAGPGEGGGAPSLRYRLRVGEVLYVPARWSRRVASTQGARCALMCFSPGTSADPVGE